MNKITEKDFRKFESVKNSNLTNMKLVVDVAELSEIEVSKVRFIANNYDKIKIEFDGDVVLPAIRF